MSLSDPNIFFFFFYTISPVGISQAHWDCIPTNPARKHAWAAEQKAEESVESRQIILAIKYVITIEIHNWPVRPGSQAGRPQAGPSPGLRQP